MPSSDEIDLDAENGGASFTKGPFKVRFKPDYTDPEGIQLTLPDGQLVKIQAVGLAITDSESGESYWIGELKSSQGYLIAPNEICYPDAFSGIRADINVKIGIGRFEHDVSLKEQPLAPALFGLDPAKCQIEIFHRIISGPQPSVQGGHIRRVNGGVDRDEQLDFGDFVIGRGVAFLVGTNRAALAIEDPTQPGVFQQSIPVAKEMFGDSESTYLIEKVPYLEALPHLETLPEVTEVRIDRNSIKDATTNGKRFAAGGKRSRPQRVAFHDAKPMRLETKAKDRQIASIKRATLPEEPAFLFDYLALSSAANFRFEGRTTYKVTGDVTLTGTTSIEGGTVVKFIPYTNFSPTITISGSVNCETTPYAPAIFTAVSDPSVGERLDANTPSGFYGEIYLCFPNSNTNSIDLHDLRIRYANTGIYLGSTNTHTLANIQAVGCASVINTVENTTFVRNYLAHNCKEPFWGYHSTIRAEHVTAHIANRLFTDAESAFLYITNSLAVVMTNTSSGVFSDNLVTLSSASGHFQTVGAGYHYLSSGNTNRNAGNINISPQMADILAYSTTYAPTVLNNNFTTNAPISPISTIRDTASSPDRGYHYSALDYVFGGLTVANNITIILTNGVSFGLHSTNGLTLLSGSKLISEGKQANLNRIVPYNAVQEQPITWGTTNATSSLIKCTQSGAEVKLRFTEVSQIGGGPVYLLDANGYVPTSVSIRDCQLYNPNIWYPYPEGSSTPVEWSFVNNYVQRGKLDFTLGYFSYGPLSVTLKNNLFRYGVFYLEYNQTNSIWSAFNNMFDSCQIESYGAVELSNDYNAYSSTYPQFYNGTHNVSVTTPDYKTGWLGRYYLPTSGTNLFKLVGAGSQTASSAGLQDYSTRLDHLKDTGTVDIGFHYYAADDSDGDGAPDGWERFYGLNPSVSDSNDDFDGDWLTNLQEYQAGSSPMDGLVVAWGSNFGGAATVPLNLFNAKSVAGGWAHSVVLKNDGTVFAWGDNSQLQTNVPASATNVVSIAVGPYHNLALRTDGTVIPWGKWWYGSTLTVATVPASATNVVAVAAGSDHDMFLRADGTIVVWGYTNTVPYNTVPADITNNVAGIAAGWALSVALLKNGTARAWGDSNTQFNMTNVPPSVSNVVSISAGQAHTLALKADGTVAAWGAGATNNGYTWNSDQSIVPAGLANVSAVSAGGKHSLALRNNGTVVYWGESLDTPPALTNNLVSVGSGVRHRLAIRGGRLTPIFTIQPSSLTNFLGDNITFAAKVVSHAGIQYQWQFNGINISGATNASYSINNIQLIHVGDYRVIATNGAGSTTSETASLIVLSTLGWGGNGDNQLHGPNSSTNAIQISAGDRHALAVTDEGFVLQWGYSWASIPSSLTNNNIVAVSAGYKHSLALRKDGVIVAWGGGTPANIATSATNLIAISAGQYHNIGVSGSGVVNTWGTNGWGLANIPSTATGVTAVAAGGLHSMALKSNGTVVSWGDNAAGQTNVPATLSSVVGIAAGGSHSLALKSNGTVVAWGSNASGQTNVPSSVTNAMAIAAGLSHSVALRNDGTVICWGSNSSGQTNVPSWATNTLTSKIRLIAAGGNSTLAQHFVRATDYPVDITKDAILIYNTNSVNSIFVKNYYLARRPSINGINLLEVNSSPDEIGSRSEFDSNIVAPLKAWINTNSTKHPYYIIVGFDIPTYFHSSFTGDAGASWVLADAVPGIKPGIFYLNMASTNATRAYIDKLEYFGTNYSPGQLVISASSGGYGNTNFIFDGVRWGSGHPDPRENFTAHFGTVSNAVTGVTTSGNPSLEHQFLDDIETNFIARPHLTNGVNIAGYMSWGAHSSLGAGYATNSLPNPSVKWTGNSRWWIIETVESFNGARMNGPFQQGNFVKWFDSNAFGGSAFSNTPVGAVGHVLEQGQPNGLNDPAIYFGLWARGKKFGVAASASQNLFSTYYIIFGDPFVRR